MKRILIPFFLVLAVLSCKEKNKKEPSEKQILASGTRTSNVAILEDSLGVENLNGKTIWRKIWVYTPPDYVASNKQYPVLYMHDGQNLFDKETSYAGEWGVDEVLNKLYKEKGVGFICIGIENTGVERINEYSPWANEKYGGGNGDRYIDMIIEKLKPMIDQKYRTKTHADATAIIGSSIGGLISYYAGLKHPDVFGKIGVLSPSFWFSEAVVPFTKEHAQANVDLYFVLGDQEGMTDDFNKISELVLLSGFKKDRFVKKLVPGGKHNEAFWNSQFEEMISWLYNIK
jgi:alpha-glucosidase